MAILSAVYTHVKINGTEFRVKSFNPSKSADAIDVSQTGAVLNSPTGSPAFGYTETIPGFRMLKCSLTYFMDGSYVPTWNEGDSVHLALTYSNATSPGIDCLSFFISELSWNIDVKGAVEVTLQGQGNGYYSNL